MEDYCTLFHIVPTVNGGYYYLCKNNNGSHYLRHKAERGTKEDLLFETTEAAQNYIDTYLTIFRPPMNDHHVFAYQFKYFLCSTHANFKTK